jgi:hypothetical protein
MIAFFHGCMDSVAGWKRPLHMQFAVLFIADTSPSERVAYGKAQVLRSPMPYRLLSWQSSSPANGTLRSSGMIAGEARELILHRTVTNL